MTKTTRALALSLLMITLSVLACATFRSPDDPAPTRPPTDTPLPTLTPATPDEAPSPQRKRPNPCRRLKPPPKPPPPRQERPQLQLSFHLNRDLTRRDNRQHAYSQQFSNLIPATRAIFGCSDFLMRV